MACIEDHFSVPGSAKFPMDLFDTCVDHIRTLKLELKNGVLARDTGWRRVFKSYLGSRTQISYLLCRLDPFLDTIIWKDPLAAFVSEAVAARHGVPVVVTVRPPVAVAASFRRMKWTPRVADLERRLNEVGLSFGMPYLERYKGELDQSPIAAAILWRMVYSMMLRVYRQSKAVYMVSVRDFIDNPIIRYRHLYDLLGLTWSPKVEAGIGKQHAASGKAQTDMQLPQRAHVAKRDLQNINTYGRRLLSPEEILKVEDITNDVWPEVQAASIKWPE